MRGVNKTARRKVRKYKVATDRIISRYIPGCSTPINDPHKKLNMREDMVKARSSDRVVDGTVDKNRDYNTSTKLFNRIQEDVESTVHDNVNKGAGEPINYCTIIRQDNDTVCAEIYSMKIFWTSFLILYVLILENILYIVISIL